MKAKLVIHTIRPVWSKSNTAADALLSNAYGNSMQLATQNNVRSIAFLNISTGDYHFLKDTAAKIAIRTVKDFLSYDNNVEKVTFVCVDDENYGAY